MRRALLVAALAGLAGGGAASAQERAGGPVPGGASAQPRPLPFAPGERLEYDVRFGIVPVGSGAMEVAGVEEVRGRRALHAVFTVRGGTFVFRVNDRMDSWFDAATLESLRFWQDIAEGSYKRRRRFEIYPERQRFRQDDREEEPSVAEPLDDASFLYFVRTIPLEVGRTYEFPRHFQPEANPVRLRVLRRERVQVPAGSFDAIVVQPLIRSKGIFSEKGEALIWLSDDSTRTMLQLKSRLVIGSLSLHLKRIRRSADAPPP